MGILVKCEDCGERFDSCNLLKVCSPCLIKRDEIFLEIKERINQDPETKIRAVCEELNLSDRVTGYLIKKDREETDFQRDKTMRKVLKDNWNANR